MTGSGRVARIDRFRVLQIVVVHHRRLRAAGNALLTLALARFIVFGVTAVVAAAADFAFGEGIDHRRAPCARENAWRADAVPRYGELMEKRKLGRTGLSVSVLTFGCGAVGGLMTRGAPADQERAV